MQSSSHLIVCCPLCKQRAFLHVSPRDDNSFRAILLRFLPSFAPPFLPSFLLSFLPSFPPSFLPSFLPSFPPSFLPSFLPSLLPSFLLSLFFPAGHAVRFMRPFYMGSRPCVTRPRRTVLIYLNFSSSQFLQRCRHRALDTARDSARCVQLNPSKNSLSTHTLPPLSTTPFNPLPPLPPSSPKVSHHQDT